MNHYGGDQLIEQVHPSHPLDEGDLKVTVAVEHRPVADFKVFRKELDAEDQSGSVQVQLTGVLAALITSGQLEPGVRFPPERELCKQLGVSRTTLRNILGRLEQQNLITRQVGRGTYISEPKFEHLMTMPGSMQGQDDQSSLETYEIIQIKRLVTDSATAELLTVREGELVVRLSRLRSLAGKKHSLETSMFPAAVFDSFDETDLTALGVGSLLQKAGLTAVRSRQRFDPVPASEWEAKNLEIEVQTPIMLVTRRTWGMSGAVIEYSRDYHRADRNSFLIDVFGK